MSNAGLVVSSLKKSLAWLTTVTLFTFIVFSYQNCAKPLDELGVNTAASVGVCTFTNPATVYLNGILAIQVNYTPTNYKLYVTITQDSTGISTSKTITQGGIINVQYTTSAQQGTYTINGTVKDPDGAIAGVCMGSYLVKPPLSTGGGLPPTPVSTYNWSVGAWGPCSVTTCGRTGTQTRVVQCKKSDGTVVADSYCSATVVKPLTTQSCSTPACTGSTGTTGTTGTSGGNIGSCAINDPC